MLDGNILITGGTGTLGTAILRRASAENWPARFTVLSRDPMKQAVQQREFPHVRYVVGDITHYDTVAQTVAGHDTVIHAAAMKHIGVAERNSAETIAVNIQGSSNVAWACSMHGVTRAVAISTDKAARPSNVYSCTKRLMEAIWRAAAEKSPTRFTLCRYGNVINSTGSVLQVWERQRAEGRNITITNPDMTRFWLTENAAVDLVELALSAESGQIVIPLLPACSMRRLAEIVYGNVIYEVIGAAWYEKTHECLLTPEEAPQAEQRGEMLYWPGNAPSAPDAMWRDGYYSNRPIREWGG